MPLLGCTTSVIIMVGLLGFIGWKVTVISSNFIALMLILNMAMNIHVTVRFLQLKKEFSNLSNAEAILETSKKINTILRKVVTEKEGTASLADIYGYDVGGKTGTSQKYGNKSENLNTFISVFPSQDPKYVLLVMLENPQVATDLIYNYRGIKIKGTRNEAGWNSVYIAGKIIKKIGPILAIKNKEFYNKHVAKKLN